MKLDLKTWCEQNNSQLLNEWDYEKNNELEIFPDKVTYASNNKAWWICSEGHSFDMEIAQKSCSHYNCPICRGMRVVKGVNDFQSQCPEYMTEWNWEKNIIKPDEIFKSAKKKVWWKCSKCGHEYQQYVNNKVWRHQGCPNCAGQVHHSLVGQKFGKLTVIKELDKFKIDGRGKRKMVLCKCDCGKEIEVTEHAIKSGNTQSCGCSLSKPINFEGRTYTIYCITNLINGMKYIGQTIQDKLSYRTRNGNGYKRYENPIMYNDIQKYGWNNFKEEIICQVYSKKDADEKEREYVQKYNTFYPNGYNQTRGGRKGGCGYKQNEKAKEKMRGRIVTQETREKQSQIMKQAHKDNPEKYAKGRQKATIKIKETGALKGANNGSAKAIEQYDKDWNYIKTYPCMTDWANETGRKGTGNLGLIKYYPNKLIGGYHWKFVEQ